MNNETGRHSGIIIKDMNKEITWKALILCPIIYIAAMGTANYYTHRRYNVSYSDPLYLKYMLPFFAVLCVAAMIMWVIFKKKIRPPKGTKKMPVYYLIYFIPLAVAAVPAVMPQGEHSVEGIPVIAAVFVGIAEEMMFRRFLFAGLIQKMSLYDYKWPLFLSAGFFAVLHSVNVFAGMDTMTVLMQVGMPFLAGIFYALMYDYTGKIGLIIILHALWDYVLVSVESSPAIIGLLLLTIIIALLLIESVLIAALIVRKERRKRNIEQ